MSLMDRMKKAGRMVVDTGAKTMLKTDIMLLEREIKQRKQSFGIEVYDSMESLQIDNELTMEQKEKRIRLAFDRARKDIAVIMAKIEVKKEELAILEAQMAAASRNDANDLAYGNIPPSSGNVFMTGHPSDFR